MNQSIKKPILFVILICFVFSLCACSKSGQFEMDGKKTFSGSQVIENIPDKVSVSLDFDKKMFLLTESALSSKLNKGSFEIDGNAIVLTCDDDKNLQFVFTIDRNELIFNAEKSTSKEFVKDKTRLTLVEYK